MEKSKLEEKLDFDEDSFEDKAKKGAGAATLVATGALSILHTLSHIVPALGVVGLTLGENYAPIYNLVSNEYMQIAYLPFVAVSFWYMYRDHKHHKHEHELRKENERLRKLLQKRK